MSRLIVGPFNRVEGDLEVKLDIAGGQVEKAYVVSPLYRGFEQILVGKNPDDALVYAPRICGICSVSQSMAAATALAAAQSITPAPNGELAANLVLAAENIVDHLTHFYLFFMPDFCRDIYAAEPWYGTTTERFSAMKGQATQDMLPARAGFLHLVGLLAGKWPHSLSLQPGGTTKTLAPHEQFRLQAILAQFRKFLEGSLFGADLDFISGLSSLTELERWLAEKGPYHSDFCHFLHISKGLDLKNLGRAADHFMSYGAYSIEGNHLFVRGVFDGDTVKTLDTNRIAEGVSHSWMMADGHPRHPFDGVTEPDGQMADGYSWCKAPRLDGRTAEVGALARQLVAGHPLVRDAVAQNGGNVENRILARLLEIALIVPVMQEWTTALRPDDPFCHHGHMPDQARWAGLVEAARGGLGHWLNVERGRIKNYQIIAPTTWNFSPRDEGNNPGPLEQALAGAPVRRGETDPVAVQHIVRSFDPCMVCTVH